MAGASTTHSQLRKLCLALPKSEEVVISRGPTYRVDEKIFALDRTIEGAPTLWCKVAQGMQATMIAADPRKFFSPPYYGSKGWIGVRLDGDIDWDEIAGLIAKSYALVAPKRAEATPKRK